MTRAPWHLSITLLMVWLILLWAGCAGVRPARPPAELLAQRQAHDAQQAERGRAFGQRMIELMKARYDAHPGAPLMFDILVLSGGGDWGAFGAGVLKGWSRVHGPLAKPEFDVVTGVSTGALIAPFAFLGDAPSLDTIVELYRNPRRDLVKQRWPLYFLPANESFATMPGLGEHGGDCRGAGRDSVLIAVRLLHSGPGDSDTGGNAPQYAAGADDFTACAGIHLRQDHRARAGGTRIGVRAVRGAGTDRRRLDAQLRGRTTRGRPLHGFRSERSDPCGWLDLLPDARPHKAARRFRVDRHGVYHAARHRSRELLDSRPQLVAELIRYNGHQGEQSL